MNKAFKKGKKCRYSNKKCNPFAVERRIIHIFAEEFMDALDRLGKEVTLKWSAEGVGYDVREGDHGEV